MSFMVNKKNSTQFTYRLFAPTFHKRNTVELSAVSNKIKRTKIVFMLFGTYVSTPLAIAYRNFVVEKKQMSCSNDHARR